jgi:hypothetical protein
MKIYSTSIVREREVEHHTKILAKHPDGAPKNAQYLEPQDVFLFYLKRKIRQYLFQ